jgi:hypothetical protein
MEGGTPVQKQKPWFFTTDCETRMVTHNAGFLIVQSYYPRAGKRLGKGTNTKQRVPSNEMKFQHPATSH